MRYAILVTALLAAGCGQPSVTTPAPLPVAPVAQAPALAPAVPLDPAMKTVLAADKAESLARQCSRISPGPVSGSWTPDGALINEVEAMLGAEIERQLAATSAAGSKPLDYFRQYAGFVIGGKQVVYVNGVHRDAVDRAPAPQQESWKTQPVMICDGGTITFGVEYDPATKAFTNFAFNGKL